MQPRHIEIQSQDRIWLYSFSSVYANVSAPHWRTDYSIDILWLSGSTCSFTLQRRHRKCKTTRRSYNNRENGFSLMEYICQHNTLSHFHLGWLIAFAPRSLQTFSSFIFWQTRHGKCSVVCIFARRAGTWDPIWSGHLRRTLMPGVNWCT